mmetsp:Transcript_22714/g.33539  ORF Transcript_22714/g.33539 Transcript_22714/m.33539 type:complete len:252 (+) Transcript_22714:162-917(+)
MNRSRDLPFNEGNFAFQSLLMSQRNLLEQLKTENKRCNDPMNEPLTLGPSRTDNFLTPTCITPHVLIGMYNNHDCISADLGEPLPLHCNFEVRMGVKDEVDLPPSKRRRTTLSFFNTNALFGKKEEIKDEISRDNSVQTAVAANYDLRFFGDISDDVIVEDVKISSSISGLEPSTESSDQNLGEVKEQMESFESAMGDSLKSQQQIHDWDRKMGLKRSHSKTMRLSMRSRKQLRTLLKKDLRRIRRFSKDG